MGSETAMPVYVLHDGPVDAAVTGARFDGARACAPQGGVEARPPEPSPVAVAPPSSFASLVRRTGAELTQIAVQTGVEIGNRAIRDSLGALSAWAQRERPDPHPDTRPEVTAT